MSFKATSTTVKYVRAFNRWERWAGQFPEVQAFPASPLYISLYLNKLKKESRLKSFIGAAVYGFKWASWRLIRITSYPKLSSSHQDGPRAENHSMQIKVTRKARFESVHL